MIGDFRISPAIAATWAVLALGCSGDRSADQGARNGAASATAPTPWHAVNGGAVVSVDDRALQSELAAAAIKARETADEARIRWSAADSGERGQWAVKWAATVSVVEDDQAAVEHVWVTPVNWSPFRVEGVLASQPVHALASGKKLGDLVSFPIEELSDWIHYFEPAATSATQPLAGSSPFEGGFTVKVLEQSFGRPTGAG